MFRGTYSKNSFVFRGQGKGVYAKATDWTLPLTMKAQTSSPYGLAQIVDAFWELHLLHLLPLPLSKQTVGRLTRLRYGSKLFETMRWPGASQLSKVEGDEVVAQVWGFFRKPCS